MNNTFYTIKGLNTLIERANAKGNYERAKKISSVVDTLIAYEDLMGEYIFTYAKGYVKSYCMVNGQTKYVKYSKVKEYTDYAINKFIKDCEQEGYECVEITNE